MIKDSDFSKIIASELSSIYLFNCYNGYCTKSYGYLKYGTSNTLTRCNYSCDYSNYGIFSCSSYYRGAVYYDGSLKLCIKRATKYEFVEIIPNLPVNYIVDESKMFLFDKGANIIGQLSQVNFFFMDIQYENKNKIVLCNNISCSSNSYMGYFVNGDRNLTNNFIYCDNPMTYTVCQSVPKASGYYFNTYGRTIKCLQSECQQFHQEDSSCSYHNNEIIYYNSKLRYCLNNSYTVLSSGERSMKYYLISDIDAKTTSFPVLRKGKDILLLKLNKYSFTQELTNSQGLCIFSKNELYETKGVCDSGFSKCICTEAASSCKIEKIQGKINDDNTDGESNYGDVPDTNLSKGDEKTKDEKNNGFSKYYRKGKSGIINYVVIALFMLTINQLLF